NAIARNNLAETLVALGCPDAALNEIERALDLPAPAGALRAGLEGARRQIVAAPREDGRHRAGCRREPVQ
ncbi:MAG: hypothetical protein K9L70_03805, partial [Thiohalocapsa sp.]|nr:hypothetical protein [Thiohalocapsa sp.]